MAALEVQGLEETTAQFDAYPAALQVALSEKATELARKMVCEWGMSDELGPMTFGRREEQVFLGRDLAHNKDYSEHTAVEIDREVRRLIDLSYSTAKVIEFPGPTGHWVRISPKVPDKGHATEVADSIHPKDPAAQPYLIRTD